MEKGIGYEVGPRDGLQSASVKLSVDEKVEMYDFFNKKELIFYKNFDDLSEKINFYSKKDNLRKIIAKNGKKKYFKFFNEKIITKYFIDILTDKKASLF